jgi:hypothetical protein
MCRGCREFVKSGWQVVRPWMGSFHEPIHGRTTTNQTWQPPCSHGTYEHEAMTLHSRQLLMMGTWLPKTCWTAIKREIKNTKSDISWFFLSTLYYLEVWMNSKLLNMNEDVAYCKSLTFANVMEINSIGKCLFTIGCKWEVQSMWNTHVWSYRRLSRWEEPRILR